MPAPTYSTGEQAVRWGSEWAFDGADSMLAMGVTNGEAYMDWLDDVRDGEYPEDKHGYHMDPEELEKFNEMMAKFEGLVFDRPFTEGGNAGLFRVAAFV